MTADLLKWQFLQQKVHDSKQPCDDIPCLKKKREVATGSMGRSACTSMKNKPDCRDNFTSSTS